MLTLILLVSVTALLMGGGTFAMMAKSNKHRGQAGTPKTAAGAASEGHAPDLE